MESPIEDEPGPFRPRRHLGDILVKTGLISLEDLEAALVEQRLTGGEQRLGEILLRRGRIGFATLGWALSRQSPEPIAA
jgi:type IV pilus assembly protein PilB